MMKIRMPGPLRVLMCAVAAMALGSVAEALVLIDFNSGALVNTNSTNGGLDAIDTYMSDLWGSAVNVTKGARSAKNAPENLGQLYLGNTDGYVGRGKDDFDPNPNKDVYLFNRWNEGCSGCDRITILFLGEGVSYFEVDWQIFPITKHSNDKADFKILADGNLLIGSYASLEPKGNAARESGMLGVFTTAGIVAPAGGWHKLEFVDWNSAPVGIDNLRLGREVVPEPGTLLGFGLGLLVLVWRRRA